MLTLPYALALFAALPLPFFVDLRLLPLVIVEALCSLKLSFASATSASSSYLIIFCHFSLVSLINSFLSSSDRGKGDRRAARTGRGSGRGSGGGTLHVVCSPLTNIITISQLSRLFICMPTKCTAECRMCARYVGTIAWDTSMTTTHSRTVARTGEPDQVKPMGKSDFKLHEIK